MLKGRSSMLDRTNIIVVSFHETVKLFPYSVKSRTLRFLKPSGEFSTRHKSSSAHCTNSTRLENEMDTSIRWINYSARHLEEFSSCKHRDIYYER